MASRLLSLGLLSVLLTNGAGGADVPKTRKSVAPAARQPERAWMNSIHVIQPYWHHGTWVFDDDRHGLSREPFVAGADTIISKLAESLPNARNGFKLIFAEFKFPGAQLEVTRTSEGDGKSGTYYRAEQYKMDGWLCPALLHYFPNPPEKIFAKAEPLQ
jgi:hypothetical protein